MKTLRSRDLLWELMVVASRSLTAYFKVCVGICLLSFGVGRMSASFSCPHLHVYGAYCRVEQSRSPMRFCSMLSLIYTAMTHI